MITLDTVTLPEDLHWEDEFGWTPVASSLDYTLAGAGEIQLGKKLTGRSITLSAEDDERCWTTRATVLALKSLADQPGKQMQLDFHGRTFTTMFAPGELPFDAEPIWREWPDDDADQWMLKSVRLIEVAAV